MTFLTVLVCCITLAFSEELCDETRKGCCEYVSEWGLIPYQRWGDTPENKKQWWEDNNCNSITGGSSLTQCPYTCTVECDNFQGGACDMDNNEGLIGLIPNDEPCSAETCEQKCLAAAQEYGTGCCQWGWLMQDIEGKTCYYFKEVGDDGYGTRYWMQREHKRQVCKSIANEAEGAVGDINGKPLENDEYSRICNYGGKDSGECDRRRGSWASDSCNHCTRGSRWEGSGPLAVFGVGNHWCCTWKDLNTYNDCTCYKKRGEEAVGNGTLAYEQDGPHHSWVTYGLAAVGVCFLLYGAGNFYLKA